MVPAAGRPGYEEAAAAVGKQPLRSSSLVSLGLVLLGGAEPAGRATILSLSELSVLRAL